MKKAIIAMLISLGFSFPVSHAAEVASSDIYAFTARTIEGGERSLESYRGKVILIVNTASRCGFTGQYKDLQAIYGKYKDEGFEILAFPCNDFLFQEPGTNKEIQAFCDLQFKTTFDLFEKIHVKGRKAHPLYSYLVSHPDFGGKITWNFNKFLISKNGEVVNRFRTRDNPQDDIVVAAIEQALRDK